MRKRILMTGAGAPGAPGILKCLQNSDVEVFCVDCRDNAVGKFLNPSENFTVIPNAKDSRFLDEVLKICIFNEIKLIMPLVTAELQIFSENIEKLKQHGIEVLVSPSNGLRIANDKGLLYQFFEHDEQNIIPKFKIVNNLVDLELAFDFFKYPNNDICVKPCISNGSRGFRVVTEKIDEYDLFFNHKPNSTYISQNSLKSLLANRDFPQLLISEYLPGDEFSVDCIVEHGKCRVVIPRSRTRMNGGISVEGEIVEENELIVKSRLIVEKLELHGNIGIQFKKDINFNYKLLEINPRVQGTIVAASGAGINLPGLAVRMVFGEEIAWDNLEIRWGTKFIRYWEEVFYV